MILKIPVVIGDETVTVLFRRDAINVIIPRDKGAGCDIYVHHILEPFRARVPLSQLAPFVARSHPEGSMTLREVPQNQDPRKPEVGSVWTTETGDRR